jgi:hypothetical protein
MIVKDLSEKLAREGTVSSVYLLQEKGASFSQRVALQNEVTFLLAAITG